MRWLKKLLAPEKAERRESTASTEMAKPPTRYGSTKKRDVSYFVAKGNEDFAHLYSISGILKRMDEIDTAITKLHSPDISATLDLHDHLNREHAHVLELLERVKIGALAELQFELEDLDKLLIETLAEIKLRIKKESVLQSGGEMSHVVEDPSLGAGDIQQNAIKRKIELYREDLDFIVENLHEFNLSPIQVDGNPLQFYFLRSHSASLEDEYLYGDFKIVELGNATSEEMLTVLLNGPDFSSREQTDMAFDLLVEELVKYIQFEAKRQTVHSSDKERVRLFQRLSKVMQKEELTAAFHSLDLLLKERIERNIAEAFAAETAHLKMRLEEKKPFLRSKLIEALRAEYDEYGEPVWKDVHGSVRQMLMGINLSKGYTGSFRLFNHPEDDLVEHALHHMETWIADEPNEPMPSDGFEFEKWVAAQLNRHGWVAYATRGSGDQGVDVVAERDGLTVGLQCKRYAGSVGNKAVQEIHAGVRHMGLDRAVVITNAEYTKSARELSGTTGTLLLSAEAIPDLYDLLTQTSSR